MRFFRCRAAFTSDAAARAHATRAWESMETLCAPVRIHHFRPESGNHGFHVRDNFNLSRCHGGVPGKAWRRCVYRYEYTTFDLFHTSTARRFGNRLWRRRRISDRWAYGIWDGQACPKWGGTSPLRCAFLSSNQLKTLCFVYSLGLSACSRLRFYTYERACMCTARRWRKWGSSPVLKTHGQILRSISPAGRWVLGGEPCVCIWVFGCVYTCTWHPCTDLPRTWLS